VPVIAADPRLATLGLSCAYLTFVALVRDRRGAPPAPAIEAAIPTGIELTVFHAGSIKTYRFGRRILVGRAPSADLRLGDPRISRLHARIEMRNDGVYVEDLGSRNGTLVDGSAISEPRRLEVDDELTVGPAALVFRGVGAWR
jgi:pSer/pThr/pTyr-binding forkhead associated (FHA) protein